MALEADIKMFVTVEAKPHVSSWLQSPELRNAGGNEVTIADIDIWEACAESGRSLLG